MRKLRPLQEPIRLQDLLKELRKREHMLLTCWEISIVRNDDQGLENAARGCSIFIPEVTVFLYTD